MENLLFKTASERWLTSKKPTVKETTYQRYKLIIEKHLNKEFGNLQISQISETTWRSFVKFLTDKYCYNTSHAIVVVLKAILDSCCKNDSEKFSYGELHIEKQRSYINCLSRNEARKLNNFLTQHLSLKAIGVLIALNMGLRIGEICAIRWMNIDLQRKCLYVHKTMQRLHTDNEKHKTDVMLLAPKTESSEREVPIPQFLINILRSENQQKESFLLSGKTDTFTEPRAMQFYFSKVCKQCLGRPVKFHDLRHTFATQAISNCADVKTVSEILGHADVTTTLSFYRNVSLEDKSKAINKLCKILVE